MANTPISGLAAGTTVKSTDLFPDVQTVGVGPVKVTAQQIKDFTSLNPVLINPDIGDATGKSLSLNTSGSYSTTIQSSGYATQSWTFVLPPDDGTNGYILTTNGSGVSSWTNPTALGIDIDVNSTAITGGTSGRLVYDNAGTFGEMSAITTDGAASLTLGIQQTTQGTFVLANTAAGAFPVTVRSSNSTSAAWTFTLPTTAGTNKYALTTDGSGVSSWSQIDLSAAVTGTLPVNHGGTGQTTLAVHGVVIGNAASGVNVTATGSAGQIFQSGGAAADPVWSTATFPATATSAGTILRADGTNWVATTATYPTTTSINEILYSNSANQVTGLTTGNGGVINTNSTGVPSITANPTLGVQQTTQGSLILANTAAGAFSTTLKSSNSASEAWTLTLPATKGSNGYILTTDGTGTSAWTNPTALGIDIDINSTAITSGTTGRLLYDNSATVGETTAITTNGSGTLTIGTQQTTQGSLVLANTAAGAFSTTIQASNSASTSWTLTLPTTAGTNNYVLTTNGSGASSWSQVSLTAGVTGVLPAANGGTGQSSNTIHGVLIGNAGNAINATAAGSAGQLLTSGGAAADPVWTTATFPSTATSTGTILRADGTNWSATTATYPTTTSAGTILVSASANTVTGSATPTLGVQQTTQGQIVLANTAAGAFSTTLQSSNSASAAWTLTLPTTAGTNNYWLKTDGSGNTSWTNSISIATGTSLALGGATIGTDALAITGTSTMGSATYFPDGAAATPSIAHSGDTNCGIFFPTSDTIGFATSGSERMRIDSTGGVGIGGTAPSGTTLYLTKNITGAASVYNSYMAAIVQSDVTAVCGGYVTAIYTQATSFTISAIRHFYANQGSFGAGSTVTAQAGFISETSLIGASLNYAFLANNTAAVTTGKIAYGFYSNVNTATGGGTTWGFYAAGTANNAFTGNTRFGGVTAPVSTVDVTGSISATTTIKSTGATSGIGYATGAGGAVTQTTNRTTGVTLNNVAGAITLVSDAGSASYQTFTVTNSAIAATDTIIINQKSGTDSYIILITAVAAGSFNVTFATTGGTTVEQPVFNFAVIKAVSA